MESSYLFKPCINWVEDKKRLSVGLHVNKSILYVKKVGCKDCKGYTCNAEIDHLL